VSKIACQLPQPADMIPDTFVAAAPDLDTNERAWFPQSSDVAFRPLILNVSQGYYINILRVRDSGVLSRHRHSGPVHALTLRGKWRYLEHGWHPLETTRSSQAARRIPSSFLTTFRRWRRLFHVTGGYMYLVPGMRTQRVRAVSCPGECEP
jgi:2,4'-dihydroxyacetophenone dioxygenase